MKMLGLTRIFSRFEICSSNVPRDFLSGGVIPRHVGETDLKTGENTIEHLCSEFRILSFPPLWSLCDSSSGERETLTNTSILKDSEHSCFRQI